MNNKFTHLSSLLHTLTPEGLKDTVGFISAKITPRTSHPVDEAKMSWIILRCFSTDLLGGIACSDMSECRLIKVVLILVKYKGSRRGYTRNHWFLNAENYGCTQANGNRQMEFRMLKPLLRNARS